jgi:predicted amidohydrolase YtcJ
MGCSTNGEISKPSDPDRPVLENPADFIWKNAAIYTVDNSTPWASAMAIKDGKIIYVGDDEGVEVFQDANTLVEDLEGAFVMPGIHDVHMYPLEAGSPIGGTCELDGATEDIQGLLKKLEDCNLQPNSNGWITAFGFSMFALLNENLENSPLEYLDELYPNIPVVIMEFECPQCYLKKIYSESIGIIWCFDQLWS